MPQERWHVRGDWRDVGPSSEPLVVQITLDCPESVVAQLRSALGSQVTGELRFVQEAGVVDPKVRITGLNRFFAAPTCDRIHREVVALLAELRG